MPYRIRSAVTVLAATATVAFAAAASTAHAQGRTINASSPFSGTYTSTHIDTNVDGLVAGKQVLSTLSGPLGPSTLEILDEFAILGEGRCQNGNIGTLFALVVSPSTPAAIIQRFAQTGDLLYLIETSGTGCLDLTTGAGFFEVSGIILNGTGALAGATGTFTQRGEASFLFADAVDSFGPETGTFTQTITLAE